MQSVYVLLAEEQDEPSDCHGVFAALDAAAEAAETLTLAVAAQQLEWTPPLDVDNDGAWVLVAENGVSYARIVEVNFEQRSAGDRRGSGR